MYESGSILKNAVITSSLLVLSVSNSFGVLIFNSGLMEVVDSDINDFIEVVDSNTGGGTSVRFEDGAIVRLDSDDNSVLASDSSSIIVNGGIFFQDITATDGASLTVLGGTMRDDINVLGSSQLILGGGLIDDDVFVEQGGTANISGGLIVDNLILDDDGDVTMTDGTVGGDLRLFGNSTMVITGGTVSEDVMVDTQLVVRGGNFLMEDTDFGFATAGGQISIVGSNFELDGEAIGLGDIVALTGRLTGILENGDLLDVNIDRDPIGGEIGNISLVPEPSAYAFIVSLVSMAVCLQRRNR